MLAINWFEVLLPSHRLEIPTEYLTNSLNDHRRIKTLTHRTVVDFKSAQKRVFHITASPPTNTELILVNLDDFPAMGGYIVEHGFAAQMESRGFYVNLGRHVGGAGYQVVDTSARPMVYTSMIGVKYRSFYGFGDMPPFRWGLILSYATRQFFVISLKDPALRRLASGRQIVRLYVEDHGTLHTNDGDNIVPASGVFETADNDQGMLVDSRGRKHPILLDDWTVVCNRNTLLNYIRVAEGSSSANDVSQKLHREDFTLTAEGRMNTALARDQLERLILLLNRNDLLSFALPLPGRQAARLSAEPLVVGE